MFRVKYLQVLLAGALIFGAVAAVNADEKKVAGASYFDLPSQALQISLIEFGIQAKVTVLADSQMLKGQRSSPVVGPLSVESALTFLLANSNLGFQYDKRLNSYVILPKGDEPQTARATESSTVSEMLEAPHIEQVLVNAKRLPFRYQTITNTQMLGDLAYFDSSRFLNQLPSTLIEDLNPREFGDLLKYASGITAGDGLSDSNDDVYIRGFQRHALYVDGFRMSDATGVKLMPANFTQADILKGPSTVFFGQAEPGGIINLARKKPVEDTFVNTDFGVGNLGQRIFHLDANKPFELLGQDVEMRINLADEAQDASGEIDNIHRQLFAPSLTWAIDAESELTLAYEYQKDSSILLAHLPILMPFDLFPNGAYLDDVAKTSHPDFNTESQFFSANFNHFINDNWQLNLQYFWREEDRRGVRGSINDLLKSDILFNKGELGDSFILYALGSRVVVPVIVTDIGSDYIYRFKDVRSIYDEQEYEVNNNAKLRVDGNVDWMDMTHHIALGADWYRQDIYKYYALENQNLFFNQSWTQAQFDADFNNILLEIFNGKQRSLGWLETREIGLLYDDFGVFAQDVVELNDKWSVTFGGRYSQLSGDYFNITNNETSALKSYGRFSGQLGAVYKPTENHSIYLNYSEALRANYHLDDVGSNRADPENSNQIELGLKSLWMDGAIMSTIGLFEINKYNVVDIEILDGLRTSVTGINQRVRGLDADITMQFSDSWDLLIGASLLDPALVSGANAGNQMVLAATKTYSLFAHHKMPNALELSFGFKNVGGRYADNTNLYKLDAYTTIDASLSRKEMIAKREVKWQLGVYNLTDEQYFTAVAVSANINRAPGRALVGSLQVAW